MRAVNHPPPESLCGEEGLVGYGAYASGSGGGEELEGGGRAHGEQREKSVDDVGLAELGGENVD
jgi:hypothetical protein